MLSRAEVNYLKYNYLYNKNYEYVLKYRINEKIREVGKEIDLIIETKRTDIKNALEVHIYNNLQNKIKLGLFKPELKLEKDNITKEIITDLKDMLRLFRRRDTDEYNYDPLHLKYIIDKWEKKN